MSQAVDIDPAERALARRTRRAEHFESDEAAAAWLAVLRQRLEQERAFHGLPWPSMAFHEHRTFRGRP